MLRASPLSGYRVGSPSSSWDWFFLLPGLVVGMSIVSYRNDGPQILTTGLVSSVDSDRKRSKVYKPSRDT